VGAGGGGALKPFRFAETLEQIKARAGAAVPGVKLILVAMSLPSAAEVATLRTQFLTLFNQRDQALVKTDREQRSQLKTPEYGKRMGTNEFFPFVCPLSVVTE
jgi:hypothetical protein